MFTRRDYCLGMLALVLSGCSSTSSNTPTSQEYRSQKLDTRELHAAIDTMLDDMDKYEMDHDMLEYTNYASDSLDLAIETNTTQLDIDNAVKEIKRLRQIVLDKYNLPDALDVSDIGYADFISAVSSNIGNHYHVFGSIRHTVGSFTSDYWKLLVQWNDSKVTGEACMVYIENKYYKSKYKKYFDGNCTLDGFEARTGYPVFFCKSDYSGK